MKKLLFSTSYILTIISPLYSSAQCMNESTRALLVGDSWMEYTVVDTIPRMVFDKHGFDDLVELDNSFYTAVGGTAAGYWLDPNNLIRIKDALNANPTIDVVFISPAGNDFLARWHKDSSATYVTTMLDAIEDSVAMLCDSILAIRSDVQLVIVGADYFNFQDAFSPLHAQVGSPTALEFNVGFSLLEQRKINVALAHPRIIYIHNFGLMQSIYGYSGSLGNFPAQTVPFPGQLATAYSPFPGGDSNYPTTSAALRFGNDAFHLSPQGYFYLIENAVNNFLFDYFRNNPTASITSEGGINDGWVKSNGSLASSDIRVGENNFDTKGIISFNTANLPDDAIITKASIFLTASAINGTSPFDYYSGNIIGQPQLDMVTGTFGLDALEASDFSASASLTDVGCFIGSVIDSGYRLRIDLDSAALGFINVTGKTQYRISFPSAGSNNNFASFFTGDAPDAPFIDLFYTSAANLALIEDEKCSIYPNPSSDGTFTVQSSQIIFDLKLLDLNGSVVYNRDDVNQDHLEVNYPNMRAGVYLVVLRTTAGTIVKRLVIS